MSVANRELLDATSGLREVVPAKDSSTKHVKAMSAISAFSGQEKEGKCLQDGSGQMLPPTPSTVSSDECDQSERTNSSANEAESPDTKAEKARLQAMVKSFSREARLGLECKMFLGSVGGNLLPRISSQTHAPVRLFLDIALTKMMVRGGGTEIVIPFTDIKEIYSYDDLMEHDRNCQICKVVRPEDRSGAIIIHHQPSGCPEAWSCLVVADGASQEQIVNGAKILMYFRRLAIADEVLQ